MHILELIITVGVAVLGSNGLWGLLQSKSNHKSAHDKMILGLGHAKIQQLTEKYLERGGITSDELDDLVHYLYELYKALGGNGSGEIMVKKAQGLPIIPADEAVRRDNTIIYNQANGGRKA